MKNLYNALFLILIPLFSFAQNVPNPGMEQWTNNGTYEDPNGYFTSNFYVGLGAPASVTKTTDKHGGLYAAKLTTFLASIGPSNDTVSALLSIGDFNTGADAAPFSTRPANMNVWFKYTSAQDTGVAVAILSKWNATSGLRETVAIAGTEFTGNVSSYTQRSEQFDYLSNLTPDSISLLIFSSIAEVPIPGSSLYIDDLSFSGNVGLAENSAQEIKVYPNPAIDRLNIDLSQEGKYRVEIMDMNAKKISTVSFTGKKETIDLTGISQGLYIYMIYDEKNQITSVGKFNLIKD